MSSKSISNVIDYELVEPYLDCIPCGCGHLRVTSEYKTSWNIANQLRIMTISTGACTVNYNKKDYVLSQNDIIFMFAGSTYSIHSSTRVPTEMWWIDMRGIGTVNFLSRLSISEANCVMQGVSNPGFFRELKSIVLYCGDMTPSDALNSIGGMYRLMAVLVDECVDSAWEVVPHDSEQIIFTGIWSTWPSPVGTQHNEYYTNTARSYAEFNFYGTGIKWYGTLNFDCGKADVIIDGVYQTTIDTYNPSRLEKQLLYTNTHLSNSHHIIKIFCTGERNYKAMNCDVVVESFQFLTRSQDSSQVQQGFKSSMVRKAAKIMWTNYTRDISIAELSNELNVSRPYLTSKFTSEMGLSPMQYLVHLRMSHAKRLLITTDMSISEIATAIGFKDAFYFSRFFKKNDSMTPTQYREAHAGEGDMLREAPNTNGSL